MDFSALATEAMSGQQPWLWGVSVWPLEKEGFRDGFVAELAIGAKFGWAKGVPPNKITSLQQGTGFSRHSATKSVPLPVRFQQPLDRIF